MQDRWKHPVSGMKWYKNTKKDFAALPEDCETHTPAPRSKQPTTPPLEGRLTGAWTPVAQVKSAAPRRRGDVLARCPRCSHQWFVPGEVVNALADLQSVSGKLARWGQKTQHVGNVLTPGLGTMLSGRSGRKVESQRDFDRAIRGEFRCAACGSSEVLLAI